MTRPSRAGPLPSLRSWLLAPDPASQWQASLGNAFRQASALVRNPLAFAGAVVLVLLVLAAALAPLLAPHPPAAQDLAARLSPPSGAHWLGTDEYGRDITSRLLFGSRVTLSIVASVVIVVAPAGLLIGCLAGYCGGWVDALLMRLTDIFLALPRLILALALVVALKPGVESAIIAIILTSWPPYARLARAETMAIRSSEFIAAARLSGVPPRRLLFGHIMPLCVPSIIVRSTLDMSGIIVIAAGLGFLGLGAQPPSPEWGAMIAEGRSFFLDQWWVATMPGIAICVTSLAFNLLGDGLRDVLDPKLQ